MNVLHVIVFQFFILLFFSFFSFSVSNYITCRKCERTFLITIEKYEGPIIPYQDEIHHRGQLYVIARLFGKDPPNVFAEEYPSYWHLRKGH